MHTEASMWEESIVSIHYTATFTDQGWGPLGKSGHKIIHCGRLPTVYLKNKLQNNMI